MESIRKIDISGNILKKFVEFAMKTFEPGHHNSMLVEEDGKSMLYY